jgi:hypothetical protein
MATEEEGNCMRVANQTRAVIAAGVVVAAGLGGSQLIQARAQEGAKSQPAPRCNISPVKAIEIAHSRVKGRTLQANFEFDEGKWVYGVMIVHNKTIEEVEIDPLTGKIGDVETVTPEGEAREVQSELTRAIGGKAPTETERVKRARNRRRNSGSK